MLTGADWDAYIGASTERGMEMKFDPTYKPNRENLSATSAALMDRVFYSRRALGQNVQFVNESGVVDEWSMESAERAKALFDKFQRNGVSAVISHA